MNELIAKIKTLGLYADFERGWRAISSHPNLFDCHPYTDMIETWLNDRTK